MGFKARGYRDIHIYLEQELYYALLLRAKREGVTISELVNEAVKAFLGATPGTQEPKNPQPQEPKHPPPQAPEDNPILKDNPWLSIISSKATSGSRQ